VYSALKGQSAVEYLITYGWMLIAVAIGGGVVFSTINGGACTNSVSGFLGNDLTVNDFGINTDDEMDILFENGGSRTAEIKRVELNNGNNSRTLSFNNELVGAGSESVVSLLGFRTSGSCNDIDVEIVYDYGPLEDQKISGSISSNIAIIEGSKPNPVESVQVEGN
jgi:hypothetical protein